MLKTAYELGMKKAFEEAGLTNKVAGLEKTAAAQLPAAQLPATGVDPLTVFDHVKTSGEQLREFARGKFVKKSVLHDTDSMMRNAFGEGGVGK